MSKMSEKDTSKLVDKVFQREKDAEDFAKILEEAKKKGATPDKMSIAMSAFKLGYALKESEAE